MTTYPLQNKTVFLTGAGQGLGAATATLLTERGARVVLADIGIGIDATKLVADSLRRGSAAHVECGVTEPDSARAALAAIVDGMQRRRRSVTVPNLWSRVAALRGFAGPVGNRMLTRSTRFRRALLDLDNAPRRSISDVEAKLDTVRRRPGGTR